MKRIISFILLWGVSAIISSCLKDKAPISEPSFVGNWSIVNDSTTTQFWGIWNGRPATGLNYVGKVTDHYNFLSNGTLYIEENNILDTATYEKLKLDTIEFKYRYPIGVNPAQYIVSNHTEHTMTLTSAYPIVSPETAYTHIINLKK